MGNTRSVSGVLLGGTHGAMQVDGVMPTGQIPDNTVVKLVSGASGQVLLIPTGAQFGPGFAVELSFDTTPGVTHEPGDAVDSVEFDVDCVGLIRVETLVTGSFLELDVPRGRGRLRVTATGRAEGRAQDGSDLDLEELPVVEHYTVELSSV